MPPPSTYALVGDIGGTHCRLAIAEYTATGIRLLPPQRYRTDEAEAFGDLAHRFLADRPRPRMACLAVAGPTDGRRVSFTNLHWEIDAGILCRELDLDVAWLINDFVAVGHGLEVLDASGLETLQAGDPQSRAPRLALGAGTGLGVVQSVWCGDSYQPLPSEGGHIAFAPADAEQASLLHYLRGEFGRVSVERILSGPGIVALFNFCRTAAGRPVTRPRQPAEVTRAALEGDPVALWALRLFARILGQTAGDLALVAQARGGVYLAGGIPPRIRTLLQGPDLLDGFRGKGRFAAWMDSVPLHLVTDPDVGLKGAAAAARRLAGSRQPA